MKNYLPRVKHAVTIEVNTVNKIEENSTIPKHEMKVEMSIIY
jgi:hypothetical protein